MSANGYVEYKDTGIIEIDSSRQRICEMMKEEIETGVNAEPTSADVSPGGTVPGHAEAKRNMNTEEKRGAPQKPASDDTAAKRGAPQKPASDDTAAKSGAPQKPASDDTAAKSGAPQKSASDDTAAKRGGAEASCAKAGSVERAAEEFSAEIAEGLPEDSTRAAHERKKQLRRQRRKLHPGFHLADFIVEHNRRIRNIVLVLAFLCALCYPLVQVNYDLVKYLPDNVSSKIAINQMEAIFGYPGSGRLMLTDVSLYEAKAYKDRIEQVDGVDSVVWCDLTTPIYTPTAFLDMERIDDYYKDNKAVMDLTFTEGDTSPRTHRAIADIEALVGERGMLVGMSPTNKFIEEKVKSEMLMIMGVVVALIFLILLLTTTSWFEPILFLTVIGIAIVINKGSNVLLGQISYITNNISDILQLATSMDYSVFLLHAYERQRAEGRDKETALKAGLKNTITTIVASSLTTFFGFIVLIFMDFKIGWDMGLVMAKGILCSLLMVVLFMPSLLLSWSDLIDRSRHRPFLPSFRHFSALVSRLSPWVIGLSLLLAGPVYVAQSMNHFMYGPDATGAGPGTSMYEQAAEIDESFGRANLLVAILPQTDSRQEKALVEELEDKAYVRKVMGLSAYLPEGMPESFLPDSATELFHKDGYSRLLIYLDSEAESEAAFEESEEVEALLQRYVPGAYVTGNTPTTRDMEKVLVPDYNRVNTLAMISIFIVVALSFRSPLMPLAAMMPIMMAIYTNMAFPYFRGEKLIFIAYAVVSCIQLGSTIDYAISCTENYLRIRGRERDKKLAAQKMLQLSMPSILTSGLILLVCGYAISLISSVPAISEVGRLVGRGAVLSVCFVSAMMPGLLRLIDSFITMPGAVRRANRRAAVKQTAQELRERRRQRSQSRKRVRSK